ncbi:TPA: hypothetical protein DCZ39_05510 [Patescibacteria group bacterium]|nr:hypothetical protein [Candidatus Gracilibacteria bacterium]
MGATEGLKSVLEAKSTTELPQKFEDKFKTLESKKILRDAAKDGLDKMELVNKTAITNKVAEEIKSWGKNPETKDSSKIAVLYLYTALTDSTNKNPSLDDVKKTYEKLTTEPTKTEKPAVITDPKSLAKFELKTDKNPDSSKQIIKGMSPTFNNVISTTFGAATTDKMFKSEKREENAVAVFDKAEAAQQIAKTTQETKTEAKTESKEVKDLRNLQESDTFKELPLKIRFDIKRILNLTEKDNEADKGIAEVTKKIENINQDINTLQEANKNKQARVDEINATIKVMRDNHLSRRELRVEKRGLNGEIEENKDKLYVLNSSLIGLQNRSEELNDTSDRKTKKIDNKLADVNTLLSSEITNRTNANSLIKDVATQKRLADEITNLASVQTKINALQPRASQVPMEEMAMKKQALIPENTTPDIKIDTPEDNQNITLTEQEIQHFDTSPDYNNKVEKL